MQLLESTFLPETFLFTSLCNEWSVLHPVLTHLLSAFLCRCSFRYHSSRLFLGRKRETASARSCHPWISTYCAGLVLQSKIVEVEWPCVSGGLWEVEAVDCASAFSPLPFAAGLCVSQVKSDCVAQRRSCCNGMLAYYYVPVYIYIYTQPILVYHFSSSKGKRDTFYTSHQMSRFYAILLISSAIYSLDLPFCRWIFILHMYA